MYSTLKYFSPRSDLKMASQSSSQDTEQGMNATHKTMNSPADTSAQLHFKRQFRVNAATTKGVLICIALVMIIACVAVTSFCLVEVQHLRQQFENLKKVSSIIIIIIFMLHNPL